MLLAVGPTQGRARRRRARCSAKPRPAISPSDRRDLDYLRVFASRPALVGRTLGELTLPGGIGCRSSARPPRRRRPAAAARPRARVRRPRRRARPSRRLRRRCASSSAIRSRAPPSSATSPSASAWRSASWSARSSSRCRHRQASRSASSGVLIVALVLGKLPPHPRHELDDAALRQPGPAQPRPHAVPRAGRHGVRPEVRRHRRRDGLHDALPRRRSCWSRSCCRS